METSAICSLLNDYLFQNVWNEPNKEFSKSIRLNRLKDRSFTGSFSTPSYTIKLPTESEPYYVYWIDKSKLSYGNFDLKDKTWKSLHDINQTNFLLTVVNNGKTLYRKSIYFYRYEPSDDIFVVVSKYMMKKICGDVHDPNDNYLKVYYDWDDVDKTKFQSIFIIDQATRLQAWNYIQINTTAIIINGERRTSISYSDLNIGDFVEVVTDNNVKFQFDIDLSTDTGKRVFICTEDNKQYTICHIPKANNPSNRIITHNTVDIYVYPKHSANVIASGLLLHSNKLKLKQITHNDFGIPEDLLTAYKNLIGTNEITLRVQVKTHEKYNYLVRDKNYIDLLYRHTDEQILNFLEGNGSTNLYFWTANVLSQSKYVKYMTSLPTFVNASNLETFIDTFGYRYVLSLLMDNIRRFNYSTNIEYPFIIKKPALFNNNDVVPLFFVNGIKVKNDTISVSDRVDNYVSLEVIDPGFSLNQGDDCMIELFETTNLSTMSISPLSTNTSITLSSLNYSVYRVGDIGHEIKGLENTYDTYYDLVTEDDGIFSISQIVNGYLYTFTPAAYGKKYVLIPNEGVNFIQKDLDSDIQNNNPLYVDLNFQVFNEAISIPCVNSISTKVFLNGKTLVENVDYKFIKHTYEGILCGTQIVIYNVSYLTNDTNYVEVIVSRCDSEKSYTFFNNSSENVVKNVFNWFDSIGTVSIDGIQSFDVKSTNDGVLINDTHRSGAIVETTCIYPKQIKSFIEEYQSDDADLKDNIINQYFNSIKDSYTGIITIPYAHNLYSIRTCVIIRDIINKTIPLTLDPVESKMLAAISDYDYLDNFDILGTNIDKRFVDYYSLYREIMVANPSIYRLIDYIGRLLITDPITYGGLD